MKAEEIWQSIDESDSRYEISSFGRVRSIERIVSFGSKTRCIPLKILRPLKSSNGYLIIVLRSKGGKYNQNTIHRLVAKAFINNPCNKSTVNHIDGDKMNNKVDNLEWATYSENIKHSYDSLPHKKHKNMLGKTGIDRKSVV